MQWLKLVFFAILMSASATGKATDANELNALIRTNGWAITTESAGLEGPGAKQIEDWSDEAQFFLLGEEHGSGGIAAFATSLSDTLSNHGYKYTAIEVDPVMTEILGRKLRAGKNALAHYLADGQALALPFLWLGCRSQLHLIGFTAWAIVGP